MSNYVANYVFCNEELYNNFINVDYEHRLFQEGMYDPVGCALDSGRYLVMFDTRGMEYKTESIQKIIGLYHDVIWNCVEENRIEEGRFFWDGENVTLAMRELQESVDDCIFTIDYGDPDYRTYQLIIGFPDRIVQENLIVNTRREYKLSNYAGQMLSERIRGIRDRILHDSDNGCYAADEQEALWEEYYFWGDNLEDQAEITRLDRKAFPEEMFVKGELMMQEVKRYLEDFFARYNIDIKLTYQGLEEFALMDTGSAIDCRLRCDQ